jgi:hypothetical protein
LSFSSTFASQDPAKRALVAAIAASGRYEGRLNFFRPDGPADSDETIAGTIAQQIGIEQTPCFAMHVRERSGAHGARLCAFFGFQFHSIHHS